MRVKARGEYEADFATWLEDLLNWRQWRWTHFRPARTPDGKYLTRISGHKGFPDYAIVRRGRFLLLEIKSTTGTLSKEQKAWRDDLLEAGIEHHAFWPEQRPEIERLLA